MYFSLALAFKSSKAYKKERERVAEREPTAMRMSEQLKRVKSKTNKDKD